MAVVRCFTLGIDISKADFHVALVPKEGGATASALASATFANTPNGFAQLKKWLKTRSKEIGRGMAKGSVSLHFHACMEASGYYGEHLAFYLHQLFTKSAGCVSVVNPHLPKAYMQSTGQHNKTDKQDALGIARYCASHAPDPWLPPTPDEQELKALTRYVEKLKANKVEETNRLATTSSRAVRKQISEHITFLDKQIKALDDEIKVLLNKSQEFNVALPLLLSIPAIGPVTAAHLLAEIPDIHQFDSAAQLVAFAGLNPTRHDSGSSVHKKSKLSKRGNQHLRTALFMPAVVTMRGCNPAVTPLIQRLLAAGKPHLVIVGAAMRKLLQIVYGVLKSGKPFDPNYAQNAITT